MSVDAPTLEPRNDAISRLGVLDRIGDPGLTALTRLAVYISGAPGAAVHILDDELQHRVAAHNLPLVDHPREDSFCRLVVDGEHRIVCADATRDPRFGYSSFVSGDEPIRFYASVPLRTSTGAVIGALCTFGNEVHEIDSEQVARLEDLAEQAVTQIELTRVAAELGKIASHDPLTGAVNRLVLGDRLAQAFARRRRRGGETFVALLDVDRFKAVNDVHGHDAGDRVLVAVVARLRDALRDEDTVARIGGDEFVVVAELAPPMHDASELCERMESALSPPFRIADDETLDVGVSLGGVLAEPGESLRALLGRADAAMYAAKQRAHA